MNEEEEHAEEAERGCRNPGDLVNVHPAAQVLRQNQEHCDSAQEIQIG